MQATKRAANSKRAKLPRSVTYTRQFESAWHTYNRAARRDMNLATEVMSLIFLGKLIPPEYQDHELEGGEWSGARELHIRGDFLLVYKVDDKENLVTFIDMGSHSELFG